MKKPSIQENSIANKLGYDLWSKSYDAMPNPTVNLDDRTFPAFWGDFKDQRLLEIGCGTGRHTTRLVQNNNSVTALDLSTGMLAIAKSKPELANVEFIEGDILALQMQNRIFDAIVSSLVMEHIADLAQFFSELKKLVRPEGKIYLSDIHPHRTKGGHQAYFSHPDKADEKVYLTSFSHTLEMIIQASLVAGLTLTKAVNVCGDDTLTNSNPRWDKYSGVPMLLFLELTA